MALDACINLNNLDDGKRIHSKYGMNEKCIALKAKLIDFYAHFGDIRSAKNVFASISDDMKTSAAINAMLKCLNNSDEHKLALSIFHKFKHQNKTDAISAVYAAAIMQEIE